MNTIAVFRVRSDAIGVYKYLQKSRIACALVSTPSSLKMGCGLSIVFSQTVVARVSEAIQAVRANGFVGYFPR